MTDINDLNEDDFSAEPVAPQPAQPELPTVESIMAVLREIDAAVVAEGAKIADAERATIELGERRKAAQKLLVKLARSA